MLNLFKSNLFVIFSLILATSVFAEISLDFKPENRPYFQIVTNEDGSQSAQVKQVTLHKYGSPDISILPHPHVATSDFYKGFTEQITNSTSSIIYPHFNSLSEVAFGNQSNMFECLKSLKGAEKMQTLWKKKIQREGEKFKELELEFAGQSLHEIDQMNHVQRINIEANDFLSTLIDFYSAQGLIQEQTKEAGDLCKMLDEFLQTPEAANMISLDFSDKPDLWQVAFNIFGMEFLFGEAAHELRETLADSLYKPIAQKLKSNLRDKSSADIIIPMIYLTETVVNRFISDGYQIVEGSEKWTSFAKGYGAEKDSTSWVFSNQFEYVQFLANEGELQDIQTRALTFEKKGEPDIRLLGVIHVALDEKYYAKIQSEMDAADLVLFESIGKDWEASDKKSKEGKRRTDSILGQVSQQAHLTYEGNKFIHADLTGFPPPRPDCLMGKPRSAGRSMPNSSKPRDNYSDQLSLNKIRENINQRMLDSMRRFILDYRNDITMDHLNNTIKLLKLYNPDAPNTNITIIYGASHMDDFEGRLKAMGYTPKPNSEKWYSVTSEQ